MRRKVNLTVAKLNFIWTMGRERQWRVNLTWLQAGIHGLTGHIEFNEGKRTNFKLDLLKLKKENLVKVGEWKLGSGVNITDVGAFYETSATNITLVVMTREVNFFYDRPSGPSFRPRATGNLILLAKAFRRANSLFSPPLSLSLASRWMRFLAPKIIRFGKMQHFVTQMASPR